MTFLFFGQMPFPGGNGPSITLQPAGNIREMFQESADRASYLYYGLCSVFRPALSSPLTAEHTASGYEGGMK